MLLSVLTGLGILRRVLSLVQPTTCRLGGWLFVLPTASCRLLLGKIRASVSALVGSACCVRDAKLTQFANILTHFTAR